MKNLRDYLEQETKEKNVPFEILKQQKESYMRKIIELANKQKRIDYLYRILKKL